MRGNATDSIRPAIHEFIGVSSYCQRMKKQMVNCATHDATVLITGETGTGKEVIARSIHTHSSRSAGPFVPVDCTSITDTMFASQLFGHRRGAFTGAHHDTLGWFRAANGGTIFLDEVGELEPQLQSRLLRVLQERCVLPLGAHEAAPVDVRVVAATNRDLKQEVVDGRFREDLYYRLAVLEMEASPLRERREDIAPLADYFLEQLARTDGVLPKHASATAVHVLELFDWPGNVRQLRNVLEQAVIASDEEEIHADLMAAILAKARMPDPSTRYESTDTAGHGEGSRDVPLPCRKTLAQIECDYITQSLQETHFKQKDAAVQLGITRQSLARKITKYHIKIPRSPHLTELANL
jgi:two-component system response regulator PilR (NtrC family)